MFTGLIEEVGSIKNIKKLSNAIEFKVVAENILKETNIGDSINIDGACQTVTQKDKNSFTFISVSETLKKTKFKNYNIGTKVNLERALKVGSRLDGHFVLGHIDKTAKVKKFSRDGDNWLLEVAIGDKDKKYLVPVGSIAIDGVSLTIAQILTDTFQVAIIPHTYESTTFKYLKAGDLVNLEFDVIGKYVRNFVDRNHTNMDEVGWFTSYGV